MSEHQIRILLVEDNKDFAKLVQVYLQRYEKDRFSVVWKENHADAMAELGTPANFDVVLMDYFLPGKNGLQITKEMMDKRIDLPIVFLTVNKDFELALEVMRLGVEDYLVKEEISSPVLPKTVLRVIEKHRMKTQLVGLEISQQRLSAIHEMLSSVLREIEEPLDDMRAAAEETRKRFSADAQKAYLKIIEDNVKRLTGKLEKLKSLKVDKTVQYIKDIKMIDLS
jgi:phosphoserine phosphatase RsbU/P